MHVRTRSVGLVGLVAISLCLHVSLLACRSRAAEKTDQPAAGRPAPAPDAAPAPAAAGGKQLIIWGGGPTPADAERALAYWNSEKTVLEGVLELAAGFPRTVASKDVPGLKPGFQVVVLGTCAGPALEKPLRAIQGLRKGAYAKPGVLAGVGEGCPSSTKGYEALELERVKKGTQELSLIGFAATKSTKEKLAWAYRFVLRESSGALLDWTAIDDRAGVTNGCDAPEPRKNAGGFALVLDCVGPGTGPLPAETQVQLTYVIGELHIDHEVKRSRK
jgi:hypothetical protein